jgi:drug/metabolite transporter (DMT)-like permease
VKTEYLAATLAVLLFSAGDVLAAAWGKTGRWWWLAALLVAGNAAWLLFAYLNRTMPLASASGVVNLGLVVLSVLAGWLIFGDRLLPLERLALVIGLVSLALFAYARATAPAFHQPTPAAEAQSEERP